MSTVTITQTSKKPVSSQESLEQEQYNQYKKMDDQLFQQFFQSLTGGPSVSSAETTATTTPAINTFVGDQQEQEQSWLSSPEWFAMGTGQQSVHSTPEIATPQDMFLTSPTTEHVAFDKPGFADLDVSAILNASLFDVPQSSSSASMQGTSAAPAAAPSSTTGGDDLHAALAALATVTQSPVVAQQQPATAVSSPVVQEQKSQASPVIDVTPAFSTRKRKSSSDAVSPVDEAAIKRQKNTDAARRSRLRKAMKMEGLEKRVSDLEKTNTTLLLRAAVLESEKSSLLAKEASYEQRIKALEAQLAQAHQSLAGLGSSQ
ncbi:hypothetical protein BDA99DRAFT_519137 [Phascolomyces articulosus]|uniref:BZIP domain-containing protein n=1 Tax=Phascolomyces articulosus TaxID=60185 RepID=A0AAD5PAJ5_9FUNG|nr:hypothetical protein BDA99DRAFT_519137 [Phascolomyces articulosus]